MIRFEIIGNKKWVKPEYHKKKNNVESIIVTEEEILRKTRELENLLNSGKYKNPKKIEEYHVWNNSYDMGMIFLETTYKEDTTMLNEGFYNINGVKVAIKSHKLVYGSNNVYRVDTDFMEVDQDKDEGFKMGGVAKRHRDFRKRYIKNIESGLIKKKFFGIF